MPVNNPSGANGPMSSEQFLEPVPFGSKQAIQSLQAQGPLAGQPASASALASPERAQAGATRPPGRPGPPQAVRMPPTSSTMMPYPARVAEMWAALANEPGASPLVQDYARQAVQAMLANPHG
jgi:hypothetical protein